ncbi:DMT family transporter [Micromonospora cathayae]|uniref:DMT family transporter n=1 Tax=Micromonospora cathayae TaxID=3028804 RepID=A0ABY7ZH86_9ACTN|nr:DMT family transporter [Micromonospora sp. HUAS 3]WDZ82357.1 DMT family transporter [Micromonospora sp. HUAS 3]
MRPLPPPAALALVALGGVASAAQGLANAEFGARAGSPVLGAVVNNLVGTLLVAVGLVALPSMRAGLRALRTARLPWWSYLGGLGGAAIVVIATYVVPVLGVAVFTIAQVAGGSLGGLAVDRSGLAPVGRLPLTRARIGGAVLGVAAVTLAQLGRPLGELAVGGVLLAVAGGLAVALQAALNGRVSAASSTAAGTAVNFVVSTVAVFAVAAGVGAFGRWPASWPGDWYLWTGGLLGVTIVAALLVGVRSVGVLRTGLVLVAGQLGGSLLFDALLPGGAGLRLPVLAGALLTLAAAVVAGRSARPGGAGNRAGRDGGGRNRGVRNRPGPTVPDPRQANQADRAAPAAPAAPADGDPTADSADPAGPGDPERTR